MNFRVVCPDGLVADIFDSLEDAIVYARVCDGGHTVCDGTHGVEEASWRLVA